MTLIDKSYFIGEITIAQRNQPEVEAVLNALIAKYEPRFLRLLLGLGFYNDFLAGLNPVSGDPEQRWLDLRDGIEYTWESRLYEWPGFVNDLKESPIANYVYTFYLQKELSQTTGMGQVKPAGENGTISSPLTKIIRAWNEMVDWNYSLIHFLDANRSVYPEWVPYSGSRWWVYHHTDRCRYWPEIFEYKNSLGL